MQFLWITISILINQFLIPRQFLDEPTFAAERRLFERMLNNKVIITTGEACHMPMPGWFRIVFSSVDANTLEEGISDDSNIETNFEL